MSNRILIEFNNPFLTIFDARGGVGRVGGVDIVDSPINDDILEDAQSDFQSIGDMLPSGLSSIIGALRQGQSVSRQASPELEKLLNIPLWTKTNPLRITVPLLFYVKTDPKIDVWEKAKGLEALTVINVKDGRWTTPGLSIQDVSKLKENSKSANTNNSVSNIKESLTSSLVSVLIPNVIYFPLAFVANAKPSWNKEVCRSAIDGNLYPITARVDMEIRSIYPANTNMLAQSNLTNNASDLSSKLKARV